MYQMDFRATDDASWGQAIELIDDSTNQALAEATDASFVLEVSDCGSTVLSATTDAGTITKPSDNVIQWLFTAAQMGGLCAGRTYAVGCTITPDGTDEPVQLFIGSLAVVDGNVQ